jgi:hypothetical protein
MPVHSSVPRNSFGATPITVNARPLIRVAAEPALPEAMADHQHVLLASAVDKDPSQGSLDAIPSIQG